MIRPRFFTAWLIVPSMLLVACGTSRSASETYVKPGGNGPAVRAQQEPPVTRRERAGAADTLNLMSRALEDHRRQQVVLDRKIDEIRRQLYDAALSIRDIKNRADALVGLQATNSAMIVMLEDEIRKQRSMVDLMETQLAASPREVEKLREALVREQRQREKDQAVAREHEKEIADLRGALNARDEMLRKQPAAPPRPAGGRVAEAPPPPPPPVARPAAEAAAARPAATPSGGFKLVAEGNTLLRQGKVDEAEATFRQALESDPSLLGARIGLAACAYTRDDLESAKATIEAVLKIDGENAQALGLRGIIFWREGEMRQAQDFVSRALKRDPSDAQLHNYLGIILHARKRSDEAAQEMRKAVELDPGNAEARFNLAVLLATARNPQYDEARHHYETALAMGNVRDAALDRILYKNQPQPAAGSDASQGVTSP
jgi:Tfp pilus assembly protein PilF